MLLRVSGRFEVFELSRVRVTGGKITVNVWRKSRGYRFLFESAGGERGFQSFGVDCTSHITYHSSWGKFHIDFHTSRENDTCQQLIEINSLSLAIAEDYKNKGNDVYRKKDFNNAVYFYTKGINVNCKDKELKAKLYCNRAIAHYYLGKNFEISRVFRGPLTASRTFYHT